MERMRIVVLTGAGISAESGVPTFRDAGGLWEGHRVEDVATPEAFERDPDPCSASTTRGGVPWPAEPNPAHDALARLERELGDDLLVVTQNIDDLHERAGLPSASCTCTASCCRAVHGMRRASRSPADLVDRPPCPECGDRMLRPDVVWFGEMPYDLDVIDAALARVRPVRRDRHLGRRVSRRRVRHDGGRRRSPNDRAQPRGERDHPALRRGAARAGEPSCPRGSTRCSRATDRRCMRAAPRQGMGRGRRPP